MTDKIPPVAKFAVLLAAVVAVTGCSSAKQQNAAAPTTTQATKPAELTGVKDFDGDPIAEFRYVLMPVRLNS